MIDVGADLQRAFDEGYEKGKADRPQGEWKMMKFTDCGLPVHKCSICGHYINGDVEVRNFCPNCGARMKGADDEQ